MIRNRKHLFFSMVYTLMVSSVVLAQDRYQPDIPQDLIKKTNKARDLRRAGKSQEAIARLTEVTKAKSDYYLANYNLAIALTDFGEYEKAIPVFEHAIGLQKSKNITDWTIYNSTGWAYLLSGNTRKAEELLLIAEQHSGLLPEESRKRVYNNLGFLYLNTGDFVKAEAHLNKAKDFHSPLAEDNLALLKKLKAKRAADTQNQGK